MFLASVRFFAVLVMLFLAVSAWPYVPDDLDFISPEEPATGQVKKIYGDESAFTNSLGMKFVYIEPGSFMMGSPANEPGRDSDETLHRVTLTKGFYMQTTEVTQGQWRKVMGNNPSEFKGFKGDDLPVEQVSWDDCQEFIRKLNQREGKQYRLPTEAEWEYACRAGTDTPFNTGNCLSASEAHYAVYSKGIYREKTVAVASFAPNAWGLYDMHGNVWEWCRDWYENKYSEGHVNDTMSFSWDDVLAHPDFQNRSLEDKKKVADVFFQKKIAGTAVFQSLDEDKKKKVKDYFSQSVFDSADWQAEGKKILGTTDPRGSSTGSYRVYRGGSWDNNAMYCRSARRHCCSPVNRFSNLGFRVALPVGQ